MAIFYVTWYKTQSARSVGGFMAIDNDWHPKVNPWFIAATMVLPTFMVALDTSVANVALPHIAGSLSAGVDEATWVLTSYLVANAIVLPITGWIAQFVGRRRFLIISIVLFTISSLASGAAVNLDMIVIARVIQGASGGALLPVSQAILFESFPRSRRGEAMAVYGLGVVVAPVVGPTLGGWITDNYSWRWVFYINLPVCLLAILLTRLLIEDPPYIRRQPPKSVDYVGFTLMAVGLGTLQLVLDRGERADWFASPWVWAAVIASGVCLLGFVIWELNSRDPIVDLHVLSDRNFAVGAILATTYGIILYGTLVMLPLFLQNLMGYTALESGLAMTPRGMGALASTALAGWLVRKIDGRILIVSGFILLTVACFALGEINLEISIGSIILPNVIIGFAIGIIFVCVTTLTMGTLPNEMIGTATGLWNLMRGMGGSIGIAAVATLISRHAQLHQSMLAYHLTPYNPAFRLSFHWMTELFSAQYDPATAMKKAYQSIYNILVVQSTFFAFIDIFRLIGFFSLAGIPLALLFKNVALKKPERSSLTD
ncbi:MAG TPA: DHA2 family efflux MFS transporter permease subunit [Syntrophobacteraceae bacterium]|nr:DHA2 family efflux MFS transporter permease subunit [Syntrophobacteraceae bacterium]